MIVLHFKSATLAEKLAAWTAALRRLLEDLEVCDAPQTCPHGRPTMLYLSTDALARSFGRT